MCWGISNNSNTAMLNDTACRCELCEGRAAGKSEAPASRRSAGQDRRPNETAPPTLAEQAKRRASIYRRIECTTFAPPIVAGLFICAETLKDPRAARLRVEVAAMPLQNAEIFEILLCQIADDREVDSVIGEASGIFGQTELSEPVRDLLHHDFPPTTLPT